MKFEDKYTNDSGKTKPENKDKTVLSNDTYAIGELLDKLVIELRRNK